MRRVAEASIEAVAVQVVVHHWRFGRASTVPGHRPRGCTTDSVHPDTAFAAVGTANLQNDNQN